MSARNVLSTLSLFAMTACGTTMNADAQASDTTQNVRNPSPSSTRPSAIRRDESYDLETLTILIDPSTDRFCMDISGTRKNTRSTEQPTKMSLRFCSRPGQAESPTTSNTVLWSQKIEILGRPRANSTRFNMNASIGFEASFHSAAKGIFVIQPPLNEADTSNTLATEILTMGFSSKSVDVIMKNTDEKPLRDARSVLNRLMPKLARGIIVDGVIENAKREVTTAGDVITRESISAPNPGLKHQVSNTQASFRP